MAAVQIATTKYGKRKQHEADKKQRQWTIRTGVPAFNQLFGKSFFEHIEQSPEEAAVFNAAMTHSTIGDLDAILAAYDFSGFTKIVDVDGGQGSLLQCILERYPDMTGILYDLPSILQTAYAIQDSAAAARCELVGGDMFQSVPVDGDGYILKLIIHDWSDSEAIQLLRNCRQGMRRQGKLILIEYVIDSTVEAKWVDLEMLALLPGRERTEQEFREIYESAGFTLTRVIPAGKLSLIEGIPV